MSTVDNLPRIYDLRIFPEYARKFAVIDLDTGDEIECFFADEGTGLVMAYAYEVGEDGVKRYLAGGQDDPDRLVLTSVRNIRILPREAPDDGDVRGGHLVNR